MANSDSTRPTSLLSPEAKPVSVTAPSEVSSTAILADIQSKDPKRPIIQLPISLLIPNLRNARRHSAKQLNKLAAAIRQFGFINPVVVDENYGSCPGAGCVPVPLSLGRGASARRYLDRYPGSKGPRQAPETDTT